LRREARHDDGAVTGGGFDCDRTIQKPDALAHTQQAESGRARGWVKSIAVVADGQLDTVPFSTISITARLTIPSTVRLGLTYSCGHIGAAHWPVLLGVISTRDAPFPPVLEIVTSRAPFAVFALCQYSPTVFTVRPLASAWDGTAGVS
jgi:hypothetical protein